MRKFNHRIQSSNFLKTSVHRVLIIQHMQATHQQAIKTILIQLMMLSPFKEQIKSLWDHLIAKIA